MGRDTSPRVAMRKGATVKQLKAYVRVERIDETVRELKKEDSVLAGFMPYLSNYR